MMSTFPGMAAWRAAEAAIRADASEADWWAEVRAMAARAERMKEQAKATRAAKRVAKPLLPRSTRTNV